MRIIKESIKGSELYKEGKELVKASAEALGIPGVDAAEAKEKAKTLFKMSRPFARLAKGSIEDLLIEAGDAIKNEAGEIND